MMISIAYVNKENERDLSLDRLSKQCLNQRHCRGTFVLFSMSARQLVNGYFADSCCCCAAGSKDKRTTEKNYTPFRLYLSFFLSFSFIPNSFFSMSRSDSEDELPLSQRAAINNNLSGKLSHPYATTTTTPFLIPHFIPFQDSHFQTPLLLFQSKRKNLANM